MRPLTGHFHEAERRDGQDMGAGLVAAETVAHPLIDGLLILAVLHVDEIDHDEPPDIAEPELASHFVGSLHVGLEEGLVHVLAPFVASGIHIDGDHRLGLVDHEIAAARKPDLPEEGTVDLRLDAEVVKDRLLAAVVMDRLLGSLGDLADEFLHPLGGLEVIDMDGIHVLGQQIPHGALDEVGLQNEGAGGGLLSHALLNLTPLVEQKAEIADEEAGLLPLTRRANDDPHAVGKGEFGEDLAETGAFLGILDLAGDSALVIKGHEHHVAAGHRDIGSNAGALGSDRSLGDLHHHLAADRVDGGDVLGRDFLFGGGIASRALNRLDTAVQGGGNRIPEMKEGIFLKPDVDEHRLETMLDIADLPLEDAADDVAFTVALDGILLQLAIFHDGDAFFEFLATDDQFDAGACFFHAEKAFDGINDAHGNLGDRGFGMGEWGEC